MNNIFKIPAFQRRKAIPKQLKDLALLPLNEQFSKLTMPIVSDDDKRPAITGNYFDMENKKIASTDAFKMTAINMPNSTFDFIKQAYKKELDKEPRGLIFHTLKQMQNDYNDLLKIGVNENTGLQPFDEYVKFRAIEDGRYPNYDAVIPKDFINEINVDYQKLYWYSKVLLDAKVINDVTKINTSNANEYQNKKIEYLKDSYVSFLGKSGYTNGKYRIKENIILTYTLDGKQEYILFNPKKLCEILKFAMELNGKYFGKVGVNPTGKAMVIELDSGLNSLRDSIGLVMPIVIDNEQFDKTIGDSDFDLSVAMYYDLDTNSIISDKINYPINESIGFMPNKANLSTPNIRVKEEVSKVENNSVDLIDTRIKGYRIALKVAKAENKANIEKKIKGLEIAKRMSKFENGGSIKNGYAIMQGDKLRTDAFSRVEFFETIEKALFKMSHVPRFKSLTKEEKIKLIIPYTNQFKKGGMVEYYDYKGVEIMYEPTYEEYFVNDMVFNSLEKAHKYIDSGEANKTPIYIENLYRRGAMAKGGIIKINEDITIKDNKVMVNGTNGFINSGTINEWFEDSPKKVQSILNDKDENGEILYKRIAESDNFIYYTDSYKDFAPNNKFYLFKRNKSLLERGYFVLNYYAVHKPSGRGDNWEIWRSPSFMPLQDEFKYGKLNYQHPSLKKLMQQDSYYKSEKKMADGGSVDDVYIDLFEDYENIPNNVQVILDMYSKYYGGDFSQMSYQDTRNMRTEIEQVGYTFDYGLDGVPYRLRPMNVKLSQLQSYEYEDEEYKMGGIVVTSIKNIPNFEQRNKENKITYRGLGLGKLFNDFYAIAGEDGTIIKVDGKEYFITDTEFNTFSRDSDGSMRIRFDAPYRKN